MACSVVEQIVPVQFLLCVQYLLYVYQAYLLRVRLRVLYLRPSDASNDVRTKFHLYERPCLYVRGEHDTLSEGFPHGLCQTTIT